MLAKRYEDAQKEQVRFKNRDCWGCGGSRYTVASRYCKRCEAIVNEKARADEKSGMAKNPNYGYDRGMNYGLGAYIHDKYEYKKLVDLARSEGTEWKG